MKFFILSLLTFIIAAPVNAGSRPIEHGGEAMVTENFQTESDVAYVDIYKRRFGYKDSRDAFRADLEKRRAHYNAARSEVIHNYERDLNNLHSSTR